MLRKFKKIKDRSFAEFKMRAQQGTNIFAERYGVSAQIKLPTDAQLFKKFNLKGKEVSAESLFKHFGFRKNPKFYASFENLEVTIDELRARFPEEETAIVNRADRICAGFFDLLGYENLRFGGKIPDWHFDPISQKTSAKIHWSKIQETSSAQTGDKKIIWELNRQQHFTTLGRAYKLTKNEKYAATFVAHLESWFGENPPKIGVNWLSSLEMAFRSISWIWALHFFKDSPELKAEIFAQMLKYLYLNGRHIETYLSKYFSPNTHLTGEALGLYFLGAFLPELEDASRWKNIGYKILLDALDFQVRGDGGYCEQSSHYHRYTTDFYANLFVLRQLENAEIEPKHSEKLNQLFDFLLFTMQPNGETALFGDDDGGRFYFLDERPINDFRPTLALGAALFNRGDLKFAARDASAELLWLLGVEGLRKFDELEAFEPTETSKAFKESGFFAMRDAWRADADFLLIDCGEHGFLNCGHAHADALAFVLSSSGEPIFVDSGTYNYTSDLEARQLFRSTAAHNCLTVGGESSSIPNGAFSWKTIANAELLEWRADENHVFFRGKHDGFERFGVDYEREILLEKNGSVHLIDSIKSPQSNAYELNFILSPHLSAEIKNDAVAIFDKKNRAQTALNIYTETVAENTTGKGSWKIENCWISPRYGKKIEAKKLVFGVAAQGDIKFLTVITKKAKRISAPEDAETRSAKI
ncbi:MAG: alginate lyase family protein [Acidobacteria bacterium]|nr:alginate lyase family protein [Acidobacteriota bacterium]